MQYSSAQNKKKFEYDINKSNSNKEKHGIDFEEAQALWRDARKIEIDSAFADFFELCIVGGK